MHGLNHQFEAAISQFVDTCVPEPNSEVIHGWGRQILARSSQAAAIRLDECVLGVDLRAQVSQIPSRR